MTREFSVVPPGKAAWNTILALVLLVPLAVLGGRSGDLASAIDGVLPANTKALALPALNLSLFPGMYGMKVIGMADLAWAYRVNTRRRGASASAPRTRLPTRSASRPPSCAAAWRWPA